MNKIPNRKAISDTLMEAAKEDKDIVVLCSDSRVPHPDSFCGCHRTSLWKWAC